MTRAQYFSCTLAEDKDSRKVEVPTQFEQFYHSGEMFDLILVVDDQEFRCHKLILAMSSGVFKNLLLGPLCTMEETYHFEGMIASKPPPPKKKKKVLGKRAKKQPRKSKVSFVLKKIHILRITQPNELKLFKILLQYCYNHQLSVDHLTLDQAIMLSEQAKYFDCSSLFTRLYYQIREQYSEIFALKRYLWAVKFKSYDEKDIQEFEEFLYKNLKIHFYKNIFRQSEILDLIMDPQELIRVFITACQKELKRLETKSKQYEDSNFDSERKYLNNFIIDRTAELASALFRKVGMDKNLVIQECLDKISLDYNHISLSMLCFLSSFNYFKSEEYSAFLSQKIKQKQAQKSNSQFEDYVEVSDKIKKVTYNTDYFSKSNFEKKGVKAFHFNSGKVGKFIECEFDMPVTIALIKVTALDNPGITFVIQSSRDKVNWHSEVTFRQVCGDQDVKLENRTKSKHWRMVVVDHQGNEAWFTSMDWYIKKKNQKELDFSSSLHALIVEEL